MQKTMDEDEARRYVLNFSFVTDGACAARHFTVCVTGDLLADKVGNVQMSASKEAPCMPGGTKAAPSGAG